MCWGERAFLLSVIIALPIGILSVIRHNGILDHGVRGFVLLTSSFPSFWIALILIIIFSIRLKLLPVSGMTGAASIVLPAVTLSVGMVATTTRMMRSSMLDVLGQDYITVAKLKGLKPGKIVWGTCHPQCNSPIVTVLGLQIGHILGGAVIVENIFSWPGIALFIDAVNAKDLPMIEGCVLLITFWICHSECNCRYHICMYRSQGEIYGRRESMRQIRSFFNMLTRKNIILILGIIITGCMFVIVIFAPYLEMYDPQRCLLEINSFLPAENIGLVPFSYGERYTKQGH